MMTRNRTYYLFNAGIGLVMLVGAAALIKSVVMPDEVVGCSQRYATGTLMSIADNNGAPLGSEVLQGGFGAGEWGVLDNLRIARVEGESGDLALRIALSKAIDYKANTKSNRNGVGFHWRPGYINAQQSGCLRYRLRMPKGFEPGRGGVLPGLFGEAEADVVEQHDSFALRFGWNPKGEAVLRLERKPARGTQVQRVELVTFKLPTGVWVALEQEVTLNTPGKKDGLLRVWVDGQLVHENTSIVYRSSNATRLQGVAAHAHYYRQRSGAISAREQAIYVSPFELSW